MKYKEKKFNKFFRKPAVEILTFVYNNPMSSYQQKIAKEIDVTYSYVVLMVKNLCEDGLLKAVVSGRIKKLTLTENGKELAKLLHQAKLIIKKSTTI